MQEKLNQPSAPPLIYEHEVYQTICRAKKSKGTVPGDLPRESVKEFAPELCTPVTIINNSFSTTQWAAMWTIEYVTPLAKLPNPKSEDDLRPISLTNFLQ